jgi:hypothetical protein
MAAAAEQSKPSSNNFPFLPPNLLGSSLPSRFSADYFRSGGADWI